MRTRETYKSSDVYNNSPVQGVHFIINIQDNNITSHVQYSIRGTAILWIMLTNFKKCCGSPLYCTVRD